MAKRFRCDVEKNLFRIPILLNRKTNDWLYNLGVLMKINGGYKLPKSYIIRSLINALMKLKINLRNVKTENELEERIYDAIENGNNINQGE